jgi:hypothetical protein
MTRVSKIIQLLVSFSIVGLFWLIYPGVMVLFASAVGLIYVAAAVGALRGNQLANQIAFALSLMTAILATLAVQRFVSSGFSYVSGNFEMLDGIYWPPYPILAVALGAALVVALQIAGRRIG